MPLAFTKPYPLIRKPAGGYVDGEWVAPAEAAPTTVLANIQPPGPEDLQRLAAEPGGQRRGGLLTALSDTELGYGDTILIRGERHEVIGITRRDAFGPGSDTSHWKYLLTRDIAPEG